MHWRKIEIVTGKENEDLLCDYLYQFPITGIEIENSVDLEDLKETYPYWVIWDDEQFQSRDDLIIRTYLKDDEDNRVHLEEIKEYLSRIKSEKLEYSFEECIDEQDWSKEWKKHYQPIRVTNNLIIKPTWTNYDNLKDDLIINIDPGMAFGTGDHGTTKLCLIELEKINLKDKKVLDIGCGSGILSITASKLGAKEILALDIDPLAIEATIYNCGINHIDNVIAKEADILEDNEVTYKPDIIVSNTLFPILDKIIPKLENYLENKGLFLCSGILKDQKDRLHSNLISENFRIISVNEMDNWYSILAEFNNE